MNGNDADKPAATGERYYSTLKRASDMLSQIKQKPDRGFRKSIDDAATLVETEWKAERAKELAEKNRLDSARQKAIMIREIMILPLLNDLVADFATDDRKVLPEWQIESGGDADVVYGSASTPALDDGGPSCFVIKAGATVVEQGVSLSLNVECSCVDSHNLPSSKVRQIIEKSKVMPMAKFDDLGSQVWLHDHLKDCVRMCVVTRMRHLPRPDAPPAQTGAPATEPVAAASLGALPIDSEAAALPTHALSH